MPFVGCQGETQVGGLTAEQSPSQTACLGAKNPDFSSSRHHGMEVLSCPQGCATEEAMVPLLCLLAFPRKKNVLEVSGCSLTSG